MAFLHTTYVKALPDYRLELKFNTGVHGVITLKNELWGDMFESLKQPELFATARHDPVMRTVAWDNGADLAPEFLLSLLQSQSQTLANP